MASPDKYVLWGSSGHAKVLGDIISVRGGAVVALFDNRDIASALTDVPLYLGEKGFLEWIQQQEHPGEILGLVAIGGGRGRDRRYFQKLFRSVGLTVPILTHPSATVSSKAVLGSGSQILAQANVAADARLGEACIVNHQANVDHESALGDGVHVAPGAVLCGCVNVGDNAFIGAGSVVLPRISIGEDSLVGAGSVVTRDVPAGVVVAGNPARVIKSI